MYSEIIEKLKEQLSKEEFNKINNKTIHLGIFSEPYLSYLLDGQKTIESRFSTKRIAPYKKITKDDIVLIKKSGGDIVGYFTIKEVLFFDLNTTLVAEIKEKYSKNLCVDDKFWQLKANSKYATLIVINNVKKLKPFHIDKKGMQTWIILPETSKRLQED